jgi:uncharacterized protein YndB with AHSA1/START domain
MPAAAAQDDSFRTTISVEETPAEVFAAISDVRRWWSQNIEGATDTVGGEFTYRNMPAHRCTIRVTELVPGERVVWHVVDNFFAFTDDKTEWQGTEIRFDIARKGDTTELIFTHLGLVPDYECFDVCSNAWGFYVNTSLRGLIRTGQGVPNQKEQDDSV